MELRCYKKYLIIISLVVLGSLALSNITKIEASSSQENQTSNPTSSDPVQLDFMFDRDDDLSASITITPANTATNTSVNNPVQVYFDLNVVELSEVIENIKVYKASNMQEVAGTWSTTNNRTFIFTPTVKFYPYTQYRVIISENIEAEGLGRELHVDDLSGTDIQSDGDLSLEQYEPQSDIQLNAIINNDIVSNFTTGKAYIRISTPFYMQPYTLSCELTSLRMALNYYGVNIGGAGTAEMTLLNHIGISQPYQKYWSYGRPYWGDPDAGWVGDINGYMNVTGYGTTAQQVEKAAVKYRPNSYDVYNWNVQGLATELHNGNPVVVWFAAGQKTYWYTTQGKYVKGMNYHSILAIGYDGTPQNPEVFYFHDPLHGTVSYTTAYWDSLWSQMSRQAVVVK
ncbi:C39 family peptidase [Candidatus Dojkabacteria bacterium]|nr:C39 family peptidase [Candidatus Dojkabacteria bacterium]